MTRRALAGWIGVACLTAGCGGDEAAVPDAAASATLAPVPSEDNRPPEIERVRLDPSEPLPGDRVRAVVTARDADGDRVSQVFRWELAGVELEESGAEIELHSAEKGDPLEVEVVASDGRAQSEPARASATVANQRPVLENVALQPIGSVLPGQPAVASPQGSDPDGDSVEFRYHWTVNQSPVEAPDEPSFATEGLNPGDEIRVQVVA